MNKICSKAELVNEADSGNESRDLNTDTRSSISSFSTLPADKAYDAEYIEPQQGFWTKTYHKIFPPRGAWAKWLTWILFLLLIYGTLWSLAPHKIIPGNSSFGLLVTFLLCLSAEALIIKIPMPRGFPPLPQLLASLLMGLLLRNLPSPVNPAAYIDPHWSATLRTLSLAVILTRAGLELDPDAMMKVKWAVVRLAFTPCVVETTTIAIVAHYLMGFPFLWSFMMGFMLAAVSPAVVIPCLIILADGGYGVEKGVPSLVMAASGIDDVLAIAGFTVLLGIAMPHNLEEEIIGAGNSFSTIVPNVTDVSIIYSELAGTTVANVNDHFVLREVGGALVEVIIGIIGGIVCGYFITFIPPASMKYKDFCRGSYLLCIGIFAVFATEHWGIPGAGALWALGMSFVASIRWGRKACKPLEIGWHYMWIGFQPLMFGLTGATVDISTMDGETIWKGLVVLSCGLIVRMIVSSSVVFGQGFKKKEKAFVAISWTPKGTVQAALGSAALDTAIALNRSPEEVRWGEQILILAVLVTLLTAPAGAFGISYSGPKLLQQKPKEGMENKAYIEDPEEIKTHPNGNDMDVQFNNNEYSVNVDTYFTEL